MDLKNKRNYYEVLETTPNASQKDIEMAYIRSKNAYSEDSVAIYSLMNADDCSRMLELIEEAYSVLGDPDKRSQYNQARGILNSPSEATTFHQPQQSSAKTQKNVHFLNQIEDQIEDTQNQIMEPMSSISETTHIDHSFHKEKNSDVCKFSAVKKFALEFSRDENFEQEIENTQDFSGDFLKKIREYKNVSVKRMSEMTKILKTYLHYIEEEDFDRLPATAYTRGFIFQYAKCLKLNPDLVSNSYIARLKKFRGESLGTNVELKRSNAK
jgi:curved DNA-binding protein CbpA